MMRNAAWLRLVSYCSLWVIAGSLLMAALLAGASLAFGFSPDVVTVSGVISDSHCGAKHATNSGKTPAECARACQQQGAKYVVVNGTMTYMLAGSQSKFDAFAGQRAQVNGTLDGDTLNVISIQSQ